ncbi:hypothetical protein F2Q69_00061399 [Brassica cretica]|uniref:Uncharacterized protein n=1 Tax=Brassica cretica TaxID=69181 RepID=A0A8S9RK72_BRACR|nr:hypothetical protein F2Q69_00061399 [Brassica cretica]
MERVSSCFKKCTNVVFDMTVPSVVMKAGCLVASSVVNALITIAAPARDLFLVRDNIRQLASEDQGVPDQSTKDVRDPIEATRSIPARVPFVSSSRLNSFGGPIQQSSKVKR